MSSRRTFRMRAGPAPRVVCWTCSRRCAKITGKVVSRSSRWRCHGALIVAGLATALLAPLAGQEPPARDPFPAFVDGLKAEALSRGVSAAVVERALTGLE